MTIIWLLLIYCIVYFILSRSFLAINRKHVSDNPQIIFVPYVLMATMPGQLIHHALKIVFYPAWFLDHLIFHAPPLSNLSDINFD